MVGSASAVAGPESMATSNIGLSVLDLPKSAIHPPMVVLTAASAGRILVWPH